MRKWWDAGTCPVCQTGRTFHEDCLRAAVLWIASDVYETAAEASVVRRLAARCYLCGSAETTDAEHVQPRALGGLDLWPNMAGACLRCNLGKRAKIGHLTDIQLARAANHQQMFRDAYARSTMAVAIVGVKYRDWRPEDLMTDGILDLNLLEDVAMRFFPDGPPEDDVGVRRSKYGFVIRL